MTLPEFETLPSDALDTFSEISNEASHKLVSAVRSPADSVASGNA